MALLELHGCTKVFGGLRAVSDVSLAVEPGALVGLIGPNGAGKTTVFNLITGVYEPTGGEIRLEGHSLVRLTPAQVAARGISRTFQNIRLFPALSVLDNVRVASQLRGGSRSWEAMFRLGGHYRSERAIEERARQILALFGLEHQAHAQARSLPYGDQRRLEIARALATTPRLLLLDEPAAGMNPQEKEELMQLIRRLRDEFGVGILLIEHDMPVVMGTCEHIVVLDHGEVLAAGEPAAIRRDPRVIKAYLGEPD